MGTRWGAEEEEEEVGSDQEGCGEAVHVQRGEEIRKTGREKGTMKCYTALLVPLRSQASSSGTDLVSGGWADLIGEAHGVIHNS